MNKTGATGNPATVNQPENLAPLAGSGGSVVETLTCTRCKRDYRTEEPLVTLAGKKYPRKLCYRCVVEVIILGETGTPSQSEKVEQP